MTSEAKTLWVAFHDNIETELCSGGELHDVRDVAAKTADNAARLAALFHILEHGTIGAIAADAFEGASRIAAWHLTEARRFFGELALPDEMADAVRLDNWLNAYCRKAGVKCISRRVVQRNINPNYLRNKDRLSAAIKELEELGRIRLVSDNKRKDVLVNPALLHGGE
jgi:putative DNA primase/helicase